MKQFKHHNGLIIIVKICLLSHIRYKLTITSKKSLNFRFIKLPPLAAITASQILGILFTKDWR